MKTSNLQKLVIIMSTVFFASCQKEPSNLADQSLSGKSNSTNVSAASVKVFATGLNNPRGLKFGPDGFLYVAEAGKGGKDSTVGECRQVPSPIGPYYGSNTGGRISQIGGGGVRRTVVNDLPSSQTNPLSGGLISGVADVEFIGNSLYAILSGAGCSHGVTSLPNGVVRVNRDGSWKLIANLSAWQKSHPVQNPQPGDFEPDGTWYSMIKANGDLYAIEPNHGELVKITTDGNITRVVDISATQGHIVPTALARQNGNFFFGNLSVFPILQGSSNVYKVTQDGEIKVVASGFTTILGLTFDNQGRMYVLENTTGNVQGPTPGTGDIIRLTPAGQRETVASGLSLPTAMTFGPDGRLYVSNLGFGAPLGAGQILQITLND